MSLQVLDVKNYGMKLFNCTTKLDQKRNVYKKNSSSVSSQISVVQAVQQLGLQQSHPQQSDHHQSNITLAPWWLVHC